MTVYHRHNTTLTPATVATLKAYGGGNLSEGIRRAAELVRHSESVRGAHISKTHPNWVTHHGRGKPEIIEPDTLVLSQRRDGVANADRDNELGWWHEGDADDIIRYTVIETEID